MKKSFLKSVSLLMVLSLFVVSCTSTDREDPIYVPPPSGDYTNGIFILNEGGYGYSNASVSFLDTEGTLFNDIYSTVNSKGLGDTAQSMGFNGDNAYFVVNNSSTVEVVNRYTFKYVATVSTEILLPRFITFSDDKAYITNWGDPNDVTDDYVAVLNLETNLVEQKIPVAEGPDKIVFNKGKLYVAHSGGYGYGNTVSVIDVASKSVLASIDVGDVPDGMVVDNGFIYVISSGKASWTGDETLGKLSKIDLSTNAVVAAHDFPSGKHPGFLEVENSQLYYTMDNDIYTINVNAFQLPQAPLFSPSKDGLEILYGFEIHEGNIYLADAKDYVSNGEAFIYNLNGDLQKRFLVQIIPNSFYFNNL